MRIAVLGSGSGGNTFALEASNRTLLVDVGFGIRAITSRAERAGIDLDSLAGIVVTHEHGDHSRGAPSLARRVGCPLFATSGTLDALSRKLDGIDCHRLLTHEPMLIDPFVVEACRTYHDAAEPIALTVELPDTGSKVGIACDVGRPSRALRRLLRDCHCLIIEANHDDALLRTGPYPASVRKRIAGSGGHLSNKAAADLLSELCHEELRTVVLVHLSNRCNTPGLAEDVVGKVLNSRGFKGRLVISGQDDPVSAFSVASGAPSPSLEVPATASGTTSSSVSKAT